MTKASPRYTSAFLSLSLILSTVAPAAPAAAAAVEAAPARIATLPSAPISFVYSPNAELPQLPSAQAPGLNAQAGLPASAVVPEARTAALELSAAAALPAPLAAIPQAQAPTEAPAALSAPIERSSWGSRLISAVKGELSWGQVFDRSASAFPSMALGIRPLPEPTLPQGVKLDPPPASPDPRKVKGVTINNFFGVPQAKSQGGVFDVGPRLLKADPASAADVERALREMVDLDAARYGVTSAELSTVHAELVAGKAHQTDTIYVLFHQTRESRNPADPGAKPERIPVHGAQLSFTVKIVDGNPVLYSSTDKLYPNIAVDTTRKLSDAQLKDQAEKRLGIPPNSPYELKFLERKIIFSAGAWHAANLYMIDGFPVTIAVDIASGEAFAWDPRMGVDKQPDDDVRARFGITYRGIAPLTPERAQAVKQLLTAAGLTLVGEGNGGTTIIAEGKVGDLRAVEMNPALQNWTIHRYTLPAKAALAAEQALANILGRGESSDARPNGQPDLKPLPMKNLKITMADGRVVTTNKDGKLVVESTDGKEVAFSAALEGTFARVVDAQGRSLKINGTVKPGAEGQFVYNPQDAEEWVYNLINTFQGINRVHDWLYERFPDKRINRDILGTANIDQECNAYYTPGNPSLNFFKSSANCSDTGRPGIIAHEYGHFWDDMIGGIVNGGLSEGWGDILSMYLFGSPIIGDGFLKNTTDSFPASFLTKLGVSASTLHDWADSLSKVRFAGGLADLLRPSYIRHGENTYQYNENDEVHQQGEAWMGFAWKLRKALIAKLGEAAGAALAESLVIPTMLAKAGDIPAAMAQVLLNDMDKQGRMPHEAEIRAAAKIHGIDLPARPGTVTTLVDRTTAPFKKVSLKASAIEPQAARLPQGAAQLQAAAQAPANPIVTAKLTFTAGALIRGRVRNEIAKYCDYHGLKYSLKEYKGWLSSDFLLTVEGPQDKVQFLVDQLQRIASSN